MRDGGQFLIVDDPELIDVMMMLVIPLMMENDGGLDDDMRMQVLVVLL